VLLLPCSYSNITMFTKDLQSTKDFLTSKLGLKCEMLYEGLWLEMIAPGGVHLGFDPVTEERNKSDFDICIACSSLGACLCSCSCLCVRLCLYPLRLAHAFDLRMHSSAFAFATLPSVALHCTHVLRSMPCYRQMPHVQS